MLQNTLKTMGAVSCLVMLFAMGRGIAAASDFTSSVTRAGEFSLLSHQLNESLDHLSLNIKQEANLYSNYISYYEDAGTQEFWDDLEKIKLEQGEIVQGIALLKVRLAPHTEASAQGAEGILFSQSKSPDALSDLFSYWRGFYFLISGGFFMINALLLAECYIIECSGRHDEKQGADWVRKAA